MPLPLWGGVDDRCLDYHLLRQCSAKLVGSLLYSCSRSRNKKYHISITAETELSCRKCSRKAAGLPPVRLLLHFFSRSSYRTRYSSSRSQKLLEGVVLWTLRRTMRVAPPLSLFYHPSVLPRQFSVSPELWTQQSIVLVCFCSWPKEPVETSTYFSLIAASASLCDHAMSYHHIHQHEVRRAFPGRKRTCVVHIESVLGRRIRADRRQPRSVRTLSGRISATACAM